MSGESGFKVGVSAAFDDQIAPGRTIDVLAGPRDDLWLVRTSGLFRYQPQSARWHQVHTHTGLAPIDYGSEGPVLMQGGGLPLGGGRGAASGRRDPRQPTAH